MSQTFTKAFVIFNPNSSGDGEAMARELQDTLGAAGVDYEVELTPTEHAGHATQLAYRIAKENDCPLIVSASGDGGYNEVINGALAAQNEGATPVCAVLAAGNANDHDHAVLDRPLAEAILQSDPVTIDVLETRIASTAAERTRYAHSYVGLGLTPAVAVELNKTDLNRFKEAWIVYRTLRDLQPVEIDVNGRRRTLDSLVMANVSRMAKVLTVAGDSEPDDGRFRITAFPYRKRGRLILLLVKAMTTGLKGSKATRYEFIAVKDMVLQFDGEVEKIQAGDRVTTTIRAGVLSTVR